MEVRLRGQPSQDRTIRPKMSAYPDLKNKWADKTIDSRLCSLLKFLVLGLGLLAITLLVLLNAWQNQEGPQLNFRIRKVLIEEKVSYSDMLNYAADYNGGQITTASTGKTAFFSSLLNPNENPAEKVLSDDNSKGNCWGFESSSGTIGISIAKMIYPLHFTVKHHNLVNFDSAPHDFCVYRGTSELLGCYEFSIYRGTPSPEFTQTFECLQNCNKPTKDFTFSVNSNHGGKYTCVYQILIHGDPIDLSY